MTIKGYTLLSEVAAAHSNYPSAVNISLAALRFLQDTNNSTPFDPFLWLHARKTLAHNLAMLTTPLHSKLDTPTICEDGIREAQAMGDHEVVAQLQYTLAVYSFVTVQPINIQGVRRCITECLQTLEACAEVTINGQLLRCKASLLLADVSMGEEGGKGGGATDYTKMVQIYQGISRILEEQVSICAPPTYTCPSHLHLPLPFYMCTIIISIGEYAVDE